MKMKIIVSVACLSVLPGSALADVFAVPLQPPLSANASGAVGGAQFGYNWQRDSFVYGFEADFSATHLNSEINTPNNVVVAAPALQQISSPLLGSGNNATSSIDWYGTFRARFGWASGPFLFYGTGGLAYGHVNLSQTNNSAPAFSQNALVAIVQTPVQQNSSVKLGGVAGVGVDYMLNRNLILNFAYQYVDFGSVSLTSLSQGPFQQTGPSASVHAQFQVVSVGLSWRFNAPDAAVASGQSPQSRPQQLPSNPWQGIYVGGHLGGAWGNTTTVTQPAFAFP